VSHPLLADVGPPPGILFGLSVCLVLAAVPLISGLVLFGLWLKRRKRNSQNDTAGE
jgi:hypothetical protein